jgi:hypothetical protein
MSEDEERDRLAGWAMPSEAVLRDIERGQRFFREHEAVIRQVQEAQQYFRGYKSLMRQIELIRPLIQYSEPMIRQIKLIQPMIEQVQPMVQAAQQFARTGVWPIRPFQARVVGMVDAAVLELQTARVEVVAHPVTIEIARPAAIVGTGSVSLPPMCAAGQGTVENPPSGKPSGASGGSSP